MKPLVPIDIKTRLIRVHHAFASNVNTIIAQIVIVTLIMMIIALEAALQALARVH